MPSLELRGFWWYGISVSGPFGQPGQCIKKDGANYEQLLRAFFSCFWGKIFFLNFFGNKTVFLGLRTLSTMNVLNEGLLLQNWVFRLGWMLIYHFKSSIYLLSLIIQNLYKKI